jgi:beta-phosphoglucomutase-like phosphatase (HAD superfamily)
MKYKQAIRAYLSAWNYQRVGLKAMLFDMDGVLYDSMPNHAVAWHSVMAAHGYPFTTEDAYLNEGRTGAGTLRLIGRKLGFSITDEEIDAIYREKIKVFLALPDACPMTGSYALLQKVVRDGLFPMVVTGSGHATLLDDLNIHFPHIFRRDRMVTAYDVKHGKPHPEPYLTAIAKGNLQPWEAFVVENAPLGVESAHAAGLFVIAVNTGPLPDACLLDAGANLLFQDMPALCDAWEDIRDAAKETCL